MKNLSCTSPRIILILISLVIITTSCNVVYIPSMQNVPLIKKKGEFQANITPANFEASYSPVEHMGVMVNAQLSGNQWTEGDSYEYSTKRQFAEAGIGYNKQFDEDKVFEVYGGAGMGTLDLHDDFDFDEQTFTATMNRKFIQPSVGFYNDYVDVAFSTRILQLKFTNVKTKNYSEDELKNLDLFDLNNNPYYFVEPAVTIRAGYKFIKVQFQYLYSIKLNPEPINRYEQYLFLGLSLRF